MCELENIFIVVLSLQDDLFINVYIGHKLTAIKIFWEVDGAICI